MVDEFYMFGSRPQPVEKLIISCPEPASNQAVDAENTGNAIMLSSLGANVASNKIVQAVINLLNENPIREITLINHTDCLASEVVYRSIHSRRSIDPQMYSLFAEPFKANHITFGDKRHLEADANPKLQSLLLGQIIMNWQAERGESARNMRRIIKMVNHASAENSESKARSTILALNPSRWHYEHLLGEASDLLGRTLTMDSTYVLEPPDLTSIKFIMREKGLRDVVFYAHGNDDATEMKKLLRDLSKDDFIRDSNARLYLVGRSRAVH